MSLDHQPDSFQMQIASNMASNKSGSSIPTAGGAGISSQFGGSVDLSLEGIDIVLPNEGGSLKDSVFKFLDNCVFTPFKLLKEKVLENLQSELGKAGLQQLNVAEQTNAKIAGATSVLSQSGGQEH